MKKRPVFFCEYCGTQVKQNDRVCSHCGKFFSSVKCPACGFAGDSRVFRDGCPACGYAFTGVDSGLGSTVGRRQARDGGNKGGPDPLPWWMYAVSLAFLAILIALILLWK